MTTAMVPLQEKMADVRSMLEERRSQIAAALPKHIRPEYMLRVCLTSIQNAPELLKCDQASLYSAILEASQLGLAPDGLLGHAYLIPYKDKATLVPGYKGLLMLARRSGQIRSITARTVKEADVFKVTYGLKPDIHHEPNFEVKDPGEITGAYAVAELADGGVQFEYMPKRDIDNVRNQSAAVKSGRSGPWTTHYDEMAKKTVLRRLCKLLPMDTELAKAVTLDDLYDAGQPAVFGESGVQMPSMKPVESKRTLGDVTESLAGSEKNDKETVPA